MAKDKRKRIFLKIISSGNTVDGGTKVVNAETGEEIGGIVSINWYLDCNELAVVTIQLYADCSLASDDVKIERVEIEAGASTYSKLQEDGTLKEVNRE